MHSKHSNSKKRSPVGAILAAAVIVLALAAAFIFFVRPALSKLKDIPKPETPAVTEEIPEEPEPVDLREYDLDYPESGNESIDACIDAIRSSTMEEFCSKFDGSSPALLKTSYILGAGDEIFNFILITDFNGEIRRETWCIAQDGTRLSAEDVLGTEFAQYLSDYINLFYFTEKWDFDENGVMILNRDITEAASSDPADYPLFLLNSSGAEFVILPEAVTEGYELCIHEPVTLPEMISYADGSDSAETVTVEDIPAADGDPVPADDTASAEESAAAEAAPPDEEAAVYALGKTSASPELDALAQELGAFTVVAEPDVLSGKLLSYRRLYPNRPMVALTFDDGPSNLYTIPILDILKSYGVVATFYEVGVNVEKYPELVRKEVEAGCEVGSHTYYHYVLGEQTYDFLVYEHKLADQAFLDAIGFIPKTVRPPQGDVMGYTQVVYKEPLIGWSIDTLDWLYKSVDYNLKTVKNAGNLDGQVILLHSIHPTSMESVEPIVQYILSEGYQMVTISELLKYGYRIDEPQPAFYYQVDFFTKGRPAYPVEEPAEPETVPDESSAEEPAAEEVLP